MYISNNTISPIKGTEKSSATKRTRKVSRSRQIATGGIYAAALFVVVCFVMVGYRSPVEDQSITATTAEATPIVNSINIGASRAAVDEITATDLAATAARTANLAVENNLSDLSTSMNVKSELAQSDNATVSKESVAVAAPTTSDQILTTYKAVDGDDAEKIAATFGVSAETVRFANNLKDNKVAPNSELVIPSVDGVVYMVKDGDKIDDLASKYKSNATHITTLNDLETGELKAGQRIVLPGGVLPDEERPGYVKPTVRPTTPSYSSSVVARGDMSAQVGNRYAYGYCTWYAYNRRVQMGLSVGSLWGNATTWAAYARAAGYRVDRIPEVGAIMQSSGGWGGYGHVAVVEIVNADGSIVVSEMNYAGWNVISRRTVPNPSDYNFIH